MTYFQADLVQARIDHELEDDLATKIVFDFQIFKSDLHLYTFEAVWPHVPKIFIK